MIQNVQNAPRSCILSLKHTPKLQVSEHFRFWIRNAQSVYYFQFTELINYYNALGV